MSTSHSGACLCGAVQFTLRGEAGKTLSCYCSHCQKNAGGPCQIIASYATSDIHVDDPGSQLKVYTITEGVQSGFPKEKHFCSACGCTLWTVPLKHEGKTRMVRISLVEDGLTHFQPTTEIFKK